MNKVKIVASNGSHMAFRRCEERELVRAPKYALSPQLDSKTSGSVAITETMLSSGTIDFRQMAEDADRIHDHIANGGKPDDLSGIKFFNPSGLFDTGER